MCGNSPVFATSPPTISPVGYVQVGIFTSCVEVKIDNDVNEPAWVANLEYSSHSALKKDDL